MATEATTVKVLVTILSALFVAGSTYLAVAFVPNCASKLHQVLHDTLHHPTAAKEGKVQPITEDTDISVAKGSDFPSDWWTSPTQYALETRAILSKTWLHLAHSSTLPRPGSYKTFTLANQSILLIRGKDGILRAFHNICRHRAYTVATKSEGCSQVLMCRYHGWTYDSKGKLIRAPKFEDVYGFDRRDNGLFEVRTYEDSSGFVYVNLDIYGSDGLTIRVGVPIRAKLRLVESWTVDAPFNWKIAVPQGSFRVPSMAAKSRMLDLKKLLVGDIESWRWASEFDLSALTHLVRSARGDQCLTISIVPKTVSTSSIVCALYTSQPLAERANTPVETIKSEVLSSVAALGQTFDRIKEEGDTGADHAQHALLVECQAHLRLERWMGKQINPASRLRESSNDCKVADDLCQELESAAAGRKTPSGGDSKLAW